MFVNSNALVGEVVVLDDDHPDDPEYQAVIMQVYLKPIRYNWLGNVAESQLTAVLCDFDGDVSEEPVEGLKLAKVVLPVKGLGKDDQDIVVTHVKKTVTPPEQPGIYRHDVPASEMK